MISSFKNQVRLFQSFLWTVLSGFKGVRLGEGVIMNGKPNLRVFRNSKINIGAKVTLNSYGRSNPLYCNQPVSLCTLSKDARIEIGARSGISGSSICALSSVIIGEDTLIGIGCQIFDNDFHYWDGSGWRGPRPDEAKPVVIGNHVFVGAGVRILKGVEIGDGATIGAGSVVTRDIPSNSVAAGQPAKVLNTRDFDQSQQ
ncbi:acyltransferase [Akkermansiaceae bacterium]|nr:acyltransferase [Akkermansiaceae bacterium]MDB4271671.1 acyltransferase [Akkermansiaceae bacterium]MDB4286705.1 acyltransferase [bacterium]MDB4626869.1 acyltransferase [Akkermansiaceae bacterium]MDB4820183.1 acyltransferase [Akkermansiaceae bacterium]